MITARQACDEAILETAMQMCNAAQTAPKACGRDSVISGILTGEEIQALTAEMIRIERETPNCKPIFIRDADLVARSTAVVLIGSLNQCRGLTPCGLCGSGNCACTQRGSGHCAFDDIDLGIALGSAVSLAADMRVDNRVMYTVGIAAMNLKLLGKSVGTIMGIPLSEAPRNLYFTRVMAGTQEVAVSRQGPRDLDCSRGF